MSPEPLPRTRWAIQALAQPYNVQLSLFPDFTHKPDELALSFEDALYELVGREDLVSAEQRSAIDHLDDIVSAMSGEENADFWTEDAVRHHPTWEEFRVRAKLVAQAFGWPIESPGPPDAVYVPAG